MVVKKGVPSERSERGTPFKISQLEETKNGIDLLERICGVWVARGPEMSRIEPPRPNLAKNGTSSQICDHRLVAARKVNPAPVGCVAVSFFQKSQLEDFIRTETTRAGQVWGRV